MTYLMMMYGFLATFQQTSLQVKIVGFENNQGKAFVEILDTKGQRQSGHVLDIKQREVKLSLDKLSPGQYAVKVFHDANNNGKLDLGTFGIPKEAWGVSNNVRPIASAPKHADMLFELKTTKNIEIRVK